MLGSREDAEDVLQEVFAAAFNAVLADEREINVRPWLYRIARNRSLNHLRRASAIGVDSMDVHFAEHGLSTGDQVIRRESFRELLADVQQLPETQRTALLLREIDALSYEQIAHAMETTVPSVKSLLVRARISLAEAAEARKLSCAEVRLELGEVAEGLTKLSAPARRHVRGCERCGSFRKQLKENNHALAAILPVGPLLLAKKLLLTKLGSTASAGGAHVAGGAGATVGAGATRPRAPAPEPAGRASPAASSPPAPERSPPRPSPGSPPPRSSPPAPSPPTTPSSHHRATRRGLRLRARAHHSSDRSSSAQRSQPVELRQPRRRGRGALAPSPPATAQPRRPTPPSRRRRRRAARHRARGGRHAGRSRRPRPNPRARRSRRSRPRPPSFLDRHGRRRASDPERARLELRRPTPPSPAAPTPSATSRTPSAALGAEHGRHHHAARAPPAGGDARTLRRQPQGKPEAEPGQGSRHPPNAPDRQAGG